MPRDSFVHLHLHTEYSLLDGAVRMGELMKKAVEKKREACRRYYEKLVREGGLRLVKRLMKQDAARRARRIKKVDEELGWKLAAPDTAERIRVTTKVVEPSHEVAGAAQLIAAFPTQ